MYDSGNEASIIEEKVSREKEDKLIFEDPDKTLEEEVSNQKECLRGKLESMLSTIAKLATEIYLQPEDMEQLVSNFGREMRTKMATNSHVFEGSIIKEEDAKSPKENNKNGADEEEKESEQKEEQQNQKEDNSSECFDYIHAVLEQIFNDFKIMDETNHMNGISNELNEQFMRYCNIKE